MARPWLNCKRFRPDDASLDQMTTAASHAELVGRRGELIAELFLQDLGADFVASPTAVIGVDFFVAFANPAGGLNLALIEVKTTEHEAATAYPLPAKVHARLACSNVPGMLLVIDAKGNVVYHGWPSMADVTHPTASKVMVPTIKVDGEMKDAIRKRLGVTPSRKQKSPPAPSAQTPPDNSSGSPHQDRTTQSQRTPRA